MIKHMRPFYMNEVCGVNKSTLKVGKAVTVSGLVLTAVGFVLTTMTIGKFTPDENELAHEFVDAVLG